MTTIRGRVIRGEGWGQKLGYPTANLAARALARTKLTNGVYAAHVRVGKRREDGIVIIGAPTFFKTRGRKVEVYLFDFHGSLYGKLITAEIIAKLRGMRTFTNAGKLLKQIEQDIDDAKTVLRR